MLFTLNYLKKNNGYLLHYVDGSLLFGMLLVFFFEIIKLILSRVLDVLAIRAASQNLYL